MSAGIIDFRYYESVLSNTVTAHLHRSLRQETVTWVKGHLMVFQFVVVRELNWSISDNQGHTLQFPLYVNRIRDGLPGTQKDVYIVDFTSKEYFANTQTRVVKRYEGKISDHVNSILTDVLQTQGVEQVDETSLEYNFVGNDRKPFYVCTWLTQSSTITGCR